MGKKYFYITMDQDMEETFMEEIQQYPCLYDNFNKN